MRGSPFTRLCQQLAFVRDPGRADLHTHTIFSDGLHTPIGLIDRALQAGLRAVAVTDHDTLAAVGPTRHAAAGRIEVIAGVEITARFRDADIHLLAYFIDPEYPPLNAALAEIRDRRRARAADIGNQLRSRGMGLGKALDGWPTEVSIGRRHVARAMIEAGHVRSVHSAFAHVFPDLPRPMGIGLPIEDLLTVVRGAGGVASLAHPRVETTVADLKELKALGLQAVECAYPWPRSNHGQRLREMAAAVGLAVTGGSDSHGPSAPERPVGARTITMAEVDRIRPSAADSASVASNGVTLQESAHA